MRLDAVSLDNTYKARVPYEYDMTFCLFALVLLSIKKKKKSPFFTFFFPLNIIIHNIVYAKGSNV